MVPQFTGARGLDGVGKNSNFSNSNFHGARTPVTHRGKVPLRDAKDLKASDQHSRDSFVQWLIIVTTVLCSKHNGDAVRVGPVFLQGPPGRVSLHQLLLRSASSVFTPLVLFCFLSGYHPWPQ